MFLLYKPVLTLDEAASKISELFLNDSNLKTKIRRLYDIANVLTVLKIIKKTFTSLGKTAFEWVGVPGFEQFISEISEESSNSPKISECQPTTEPLLDICEKREKSGEITSPQTQILEKAIVNSSHIEDNQVRELLMKLGQKMTLTDQSTLDILEAIVTKIRSRINISGS